MARSRAAHGLLILSALVGVGIDSPAAQAAAPSCISSPTDFANAFLAAISEPDTSDNIEAIVAWEDKEGGNWKNPAKFNPLNTTTPEPGSTDTSGLSQPDIQSYPDWSEGVEATAATIEQNAYGYPTILSALAAGNNPQNVSTAVTASDWGTGNFDAEIGVAYNPANPSWEPSCGAITNGSFIQVSGHLELTRFGGHPDLGR